MEETISVERRETHFDPSCMSLLVIRRRVSLRVETIQKDIYIFVEGVEHLRKILIWSYGLWYACLRKKGDLVLEISLFSTLLFWVSGVGDFSQKESLYGSGLLLGSLGKKGKISPPVC